MCLAFIGETILALIIERLFGCTESQFGYLVGCKKNIKDFEEEVDKLKDARETIQRRVNEAKNNAEVIEKNVSKWLDEVQSTLTSMEEVRDRLLKNAANLQNLDVCSRYRLGKEGKEKKTLVSKLIEDGNKFGTVGYPPQLTRTWYRTPTIKYESFESRKLVFEEIIKALKDDRNYKIGIYGMPGVGKTRMMQEVAQEAENKGLFDQIAKIVVSQNPNLKDIQLKLAASLNMKKSDMETKDEDERRELLRIRLKNGQKILVLVDDVWNDQIKLEDIGIPAADDHTKACKIILTTRQQDVCTKMGVPKKENFQIGVLSKAEAWSLFEKKVGDSFQTHEMYSVAEAVCRECAGLPLAILAVGGALKNKSKQVWKDALKQLKNSTVNNVDEIQTKLYSRIEWSYNYLEHVDAKKIFLLCCLFEEDAEISIDDLVSCGVGLRLLLGVDTMEEARNRTHVVVDTLKTSSLLLEGNKKDLVKMHDVIRDVAISIASKNEEAMYLVKAGVEKWPEEEEYKGRRAISLRLNKDCVLPDDSDFPELRTLMLEFRSYSPSEVPSSFFDGMVKLEVLHLCNVQNLTLPSSLKNLRMLCLYDCNLVNLTFMGELRKLEILVILYDFKELAPEIGQLTLLRVLDLRCCYAFEILPSGVISSLSQLEELYFPHEFDQWEVNDNASLNELNSLKHLISLEVHVPNVELLHLNELLIKSLIRFKISIGHYFYNFEIHPSATKILKLVGFPLKKRELNILMEKAEVLYLIHLKGLKDVFHDTYGEGFQELEYLQVKDCDEMEHLLGKPKWLNSQSNQLCAFGGSFSKLSELEVINCPLMKYLFSAALARGLLQLQRLRIHNCEMLEEIVGDIEQEAMMDIIAFHQLKRMELKCLPNLRSFYGNTKKMSTRGCNTSTLAQALFNDKVRFPALEELEIYDLKSLTTTWDNELFLSSKGEDSFGRLRNIHVQKCHKLVNVVPPNALPLLQGLEILEVEECDSVVCGVEMVAPEEGRDEILVFSRLKTMRLRLLPNFKSFCWARSGGEDRILEENNIMLQQQTLFNHKVRFPALEELEIYALESLTTTWDNELFLSSKGEDSFGQLRNFNVRICHELVNIVPPNALPLLQGLEILEVEECDSVVCGVEMVAPEEGRDEILVFSRLKTMRLRLLPNFKSFCWSRSGGEDRVLEENNILVQQHTLFNHKVRFPALEELEIYDLKSLTTTWDNELFLSSKGEDSFGRLRNINVRKCHKLVNVVPPNALPLLQGLEILEVEECDSVVCGVEMVAPEEGRDEILVFSRLKTMRLRLLPNFKSFCWSRSGGEDRVLEENNILLQQHTLFNHKVRFPALEELEIYDLKSLTTTWDNELFLSSKGEDSFGRLRKINVRKCHKLVNVVPPNALGLEILVVEECDSVVCGVEMVAPEEGRDEILVFSRLKTMRLRLLPNFKSFYWSRSGGEDWVLEGNNILLQQQTLFNHKVAFPALEKLEIDRLRSLTAIWDDPLQSVFLQLQELNIKYCEMLEEIISDDEGVMMDTISFHRLKKIQLILLPNLRSFYVNLKKTSTKRCNTSTLMQALFNHKVRFPALEGLDIRGLKSLTAIWDNQSFLGSGVQDSFRQLRLVNVKDCEKLVRVLEESNILFNHKVKFPSSLTMNVDWCPKLEMFPCIGLITLELKTFDAPLQPFQKEKVELPILEKLLLGHGNIFEGTWHGHPSTGAFCKVRLLEVINCRNLVNASTLLQWYEVVEEFAVKCCYSLEVVFKLEELDAIERKAIVSSQIKNLTLIWLPKLVHIWIMDPQGLLVFHNLTSLTVEACNSLRYLLSFSIASLLTQLRVLVVAECSVIEEIVRSEGQGEEHAKGDIVFSQLVSLKLWDLPQFTSFCWANRGFKFPALEEVSLWRCPQLQTFTSGGISTPLDIKVTGDDGLLRHVSHLNNYVQGYIRKGKGLAMMKS